MVRVVFNGVLRRLAECCDIRPPPPIIISNSVTSQPVQTQEADGLCGKFRGNPLRDMKDARGMKIVKKDK